MPSASNESVCADCVLSIPNLFNIRRRYLCRDCLSKYVASKIVKRMEPYRPQHQVGDRRPRLLLPMSGAVSSLALLHVLHEQLKRQVEKQGRNAYDLFLLHVNLDDQNERNELWSRSIQETFPTHQMLPTVQLEHLFRYDTAAETDLELLGLNRGVGEDDTSLLSRLFDSTRTQTAKLDLRDLLFRRLIVAVAKSRGCDCVLWGHSSDTLAAKSLAEVAKGRGGAVPNTIADGVSPWDIDFRYPVRDLYKTELQSYIQVQSDGLEKHILEHDITATASTTTRNTSIDALLNGYIQSQGEKYPSIMANVVRTAGKLQIPDVNGGHRCRLCSMPDSAGGETSTLCYGCERMKQDMKI